MFQHAIVKAIMGALRPGWRERKARRKSLWHLPKIILMFALSAGLWFLLFRLMWLVHLVFHPEHAGHLGEFWRKGIGLQPFLASALLTLPLFLPALGLAMVLTNLLFSRIVPARQVFEREAAGDPAMTFRGATGKLVKCTLLYFLPIGLGLSLAGAWLLITLR